MKSVAIIIAPNWRDYAKRFLDDCVSSLRRQDYQGDMKFFMVDNETSPESASYLMKKVPEAEIVLNKNNDGFAKGNNDVIKLALSQGFDYIFLVNMDTITNANCVGELVKAIESNKSYGVVQARLMLHPETNLINSVGNTTHFLGFGYCEGYKNKIQEYKNTEIENICYPTGAAVLFRREVLEDIGLFDEEFWMYNEDQDIGWRAWLAHWKCVVAPSAVVYHKYEFARSVKNYFWMDRNRIIAMLKNYKLLTLLLILPAFIAMEFGLILFSLKSGWFREKLKVWIYFLSPRTWIYLIKARAETQKLRRIKVK